MGYTPKNIQQIKLFHGLDIRDRLALFDLSKRIQYDESNQTVLKEGDKWNSFFVVLEGSVKVTKIVDGVARELAKLGEGEIFGEMALVENAPRFATVTTMEPAILLEFQMEELQKLFKKSPFIAQIVYFNLAHSLSTKLRFFSDNVQEITLDWV